MAPDYQIDLERSANVPVTEGIHTFQVSSGDEGEGAKGAYWKFNMECLTPGEEGKSVFFIVSLSPQARWRLELFLDAVRAPMTGSATVDKFVGRKLRAKVVHEDYEGRTQARLTELFPAVSEQKSTVAKPAPVKPVVKTVKAEPVKQLPLDVVDEDSDDDIPF